MRDISFDQLLEAALDLQPEQRQALVQVLHLTPSFVQRDEPFAEIEVLGEAGAFSVFTELHDDHPHAARISDAELLAAAQCISCEWEEEPL